MRISLLVCVTDALLFEIMTDDLNACGSVTYDHTPAASC